MNTLLSKIATRFLRFNFKLGVILCLLLCSANLPSFACRLLLMVQATPDAVEAQDRLLTSSRSLRNQAQTNAPWFQLAGQSIKNNFYGSSDQNHDGWGLVAFGKTPAETVYKRNVQWIQTPESTQQLTETLNATAKTTHTYLGHIRAASTGTAVTQENNHPYKVVRHENETWYFMANGGIAIPPKAYLQKLKKNPWLSTYASKALLPSDSEYLFHWLLADVEKVLGKNAIMDDYNLPLVEESLRHSFSTVVAQQKLVTYQPSHVQTAEIPMNQADGQALVRAIGKTWMMSNGNTTFVAVYNNEVWMQVKKDKEGRLETVVVASEPTNLAEFYKAGEQFKAGWSHWQQLPNNTLFTINRSVLYDEASSVDGHYITIDAHSFDAPAVKVPRGMCPKAKVKEEKVGC
jgi:predicted glutamine amidotransferase